MVLSGICFLESNITFLTEIGVKDSKKLSPKKRRKLSEILIKNCYSYKIIEVSAHEIDERVSKRITMNRLEEIKMAEIINELKPDVIYIDAADVNEERFGNSIRNLLDYKPKEIISKHKADDLFPIVSAGSIVAKNRRDTIIEKIHKMYGDFGSGYPSDIRTINFLREYVKKNKKPPNIARKSWDTTKKIIEEEISTKKITEFLN